MALIHLENVTKHFGGERSFWETITGRDPEPLRAVDGVSMTIETGDILGIAGESGCGKTTLGKLVLGLHEPTDGELYFEGRPYSDLSSEDVREFRQRVQMIFQDPYESLNPRFTVGDTVREPLTIHDIGESRVERRTMVKQVLEDVELTPPEKYIDRFPRELSGGEQQRVAIARALVIEPDVIVADEPVSMLDVSIRAGILNLLKRLGEQYDLTYVFISHDLSLIRYMCEQTAIMYLGQIVEYGDTERIITQPVHPYSRVLLSAVPTPDPTGVRERVRISGQVPSPDDPPAGCSFHPRCPHAREVCPRQEPPEFRTASDDGYATCFRVDDTHEYWESAPLEEQETSAE